MLVLLMAKLRSHSFTPKSTEIQLFKQKTTPATTLIARQPSTTTDKLLVCPSHPAITPLPPRPPPPLVTQTLAIPTTRTTTTATTTTTTTIQCAPGGCSSPKPALGSTNSLPSSPTPSPPLSPPPHSWLLLIPITSPTPLLSSFDAYSVLSATLSSQLFSSGDDLLCQWLNDTYQSSNSDLRLVVLSFIPLLFSLNLYHIHSSSPSEAITVPSLAGFEVVLLSLYVAETKLRVGKLIVILRHRTTINGDGG
ncbi:hypothetical protein U1Q18_005766 [Sarracenia purpurea var. burkii]